jgi:hypothetical protein
MSYRAVAFGSSPTEVNCAVCGDVCGKKYPATHEEPAFWEGNGENYVDKDGNWHCSAACLAKAEK